MPKPTEICSGLARLRQDCRMSIVYPNAIQPSAASLIDDVARQGSEVEALILHANHACSGVDDRLVGQAPAGLQPVYRSNAKDGCKRSAKLSTTHMFRTQQEPDVGENAIEKTPLGSDDISMSHWPRNRSALGEQHSIHMTGKECA